MTHQEVADFIIDVYESGIYKTNILAGFKITKGWGWYELEEV